MASDNWGISFFFFLNIHCSSKFCNKTTLKGNRNCRGTLWCTEVWDEGSAGGIGGDSPRGRCHDAHWYPARWISSCNRSQPPHGADLLFPPVVHGETDNRGGEEMKRGARGTQLGEEPGFQLREPVLGTTADATSFLDLFKACAF